MGAPKGNQYAKGAKGNTLRPVWTDEKIAKTCGQLEKWSKNEDSLTMLQYSAEYGEPQSMILNAANDYKDIRQAYNMAKARIGARREVLALKGEINSGLVQRSLALYNSEQKSLDIEMKKINSETEEKEVVIKVVNYSDSKVDIK